MKSKSPGDTFEADIFSSSWRKGPAVMKCLSCSLSRPGTTIVNPKFGVYISALLKLTEQVIHVIQNLIITFLPSQKGIMSR